MGEEKVKGAVPLRSTPQVQDGAIKTELLPCPFCGGGAAHHDIGNEHTKSRATKIWCSGCRFTKKVGAIRQSLDWTRAHAIAAWNQRAPMADAERREFNETIHELQHDLCAYAGVPLPSERQRFDAVRAKAIEDSAKVADQAAQHHNHGASWNCAMTIAKAIRALKPEAGVATEGQVKDAS